MKESLVYLLNYIDRENGTKGILWCEATKDGAQAQIDRLAELCPQYSYEYVELALYDRWPTRAVAVRAPKGVTRPRPLRGAQGTRGAYLKR